MCRIRIGEAGPHHQDGGQHRARDVSRGADDAVAHARAENRLGEKGDRADHAWGQPSLHRSRQTAPRKSPPSMRRRPAPATAWRSWPRPASQISPPPRRGQPAPSPLPPRSKPDARHPGLPRSLCCIANRQANRQQTDQHRRHPVRKLITNAAFQRRHQPAPRKRPIGNREGRIVAGDQPAGNHQHRRYSTPRTPRSGVTREDPPF